MYICIYTYMYIYIYIFTYIYIYRFISVELPSIAQRAGGISEVLMFYTDTLIDTCADGKDFAPTCIYIYISVYMYISTYIYIRMLFVAAILASICMSRRIVVFLFKEPWLTTAAYSTKKIALARRSCPYRRKRRATYMFRLGIPYRGKCLRPMA